MIDMYVLVGFLVVRRILCRVHTLHGCRVLVRSTLAQVVMNTRPFCALVVEGGRDRDAVSQSNATAEVCGLRCRIRREPPPSMSTPSSVGHVQFRYYIVNDTDRATLST